ncbi:phosphonate C-P lyase system protein PhnH [Paenibacillus radicis (ex Xue et al. 2023)]|uniref:Phosphonate C-P lyase system protein PhnH n=1 Tax=Paenibacillus radicis (ex Xue et al. 2023) TaxID=2972489 RepID=A0ABT1YAS5_9BACL|nr:phosphonate C-P lyase system protein PhnH [Paenibacillus radicis (ex Xue et al. 2023)]MCR8630287.1 phosphonate C-P lyase system protein PhnH [Paenibacillus radicis (ex Xue et al. 2023)]
MKLDLVHDIQTAYRKLLDSMSRPGWITDLSEEANNLDTDTICLPASLLLALMLLDTEVSFKVVSEREAQVTHLFNQLTYAKTAETDQADYIFVLSDSAPGDLAHALETAKIGDLIDPHHSATLIVETDGISSDAEFKLTGPGIKDAALVQVKTKDDWMEIRAERNAEYPLGLDLIFIDAGHRLLCLPRTTQVRKEER